MNKTLIATALIVLAVTGLFFVLLPARHLAYVDSAMGSVRILNDSAHTYAKTHPDLGFPKTIQDMFTDGLIEAALGRGEKNHYHFTYLPKISATKGRVEGFQIQADPTGGSKGWHFYIDETSVLRAKENAPANEASPAL